MYKSDSQELLRHVVLFKFKEGTAQEMIQEIEVGFLDLKNKISIIHSIEWGLNVSPEGLDQGFTHCFFVTFGSEADRDAYLPHPDHQEFVKILRPVLEQVLAVDYWARG